MKYSIGMIRVKNNDDDIPAISMYAHELSHEC